MADDSPVTVTIRRRVKAGKEPAFEDALRAFIPLSMRHPGHLGVQVLRPTPGAVPSVWVVVVKFMTRRHYDVFRMCDEYAQWKTQLRELLEDDPVHEEQTGLESWFVLPGATTQPVLPHWKIAVVTWIGVNLAVFPLAYLVGPSLEHWPFIPKQLFLNAATVALLTWLIMPLLTRLLKPLLYPSRSDAHRTTIREDPKPAEPAPSSPSTSASR
jgi:antibiotic biosynthesis monooxygenase (ABM) superfamily enzyme